MNSPKYSPRHCCDQPPRLISGEGLGYALLCMECGKGLFGNFRADTYQSAEHLWNERSAQLKCPRPDGSISAVAMHLFKELNDAREVLRSLAFVLGVGGYNATDVDVKVFGGKIHNGIDMLVNPLLDRIDNMGAQITQLQSKEVPVAPKTITSPHSDAIVCKLSLNGCSYELKKNGMVDITILSSGRGFSRHIHAVGRDVQDAFEAHLSKRVTDLAG